MKISDTTSQLLSDAQVRVDDVAQLIELALAEDLQYGPDVTTMATVDSDARLTGKFATRADGVLCGVAAVMATLDLVIGPAGWNLVAAMRDGESVARGDVLLEVDAPARQLLTAERTALNLLCHLSGVATVTASWVAQVAGTSVTVRDTRKTTPGMRSLEKYAVRCGGGSNHRMGLGDAALIKDNHLASAGGIAAAVRAVRDLRPDLPLEVECDSIEQVREATAAGVGVILLDNMPVELVRQAVTEVRAVGTSVLLEASGGLTLDGVREVAITGVDYVAVGALTHSAPALDCGLDVSATDSRRQ